MFNIIDVNFFMHLVFWLRFKTYYLIFFIHLVNKLIRQSPKHYAIFDVSKISAFEPYCKLTRQFIFHFTRFYFIMIWKISSQTTWQNQRHVNTQPITPFCNKHSKIPNFTYKSHQASFTQNKINSIFEMMLIIYCYNNVQKCDLYNNVI
jgi:hypothetical protein